MICCIVRACNISNDGMRDTAHTNNARCKDRMVRQRMQKIKVRLKGKPLAQLNTDIHERDGHTCIINGCDRFVLPGEKFHHEPCGNAKGDRIERGCLVCGEHHDIRHHGRGGLEDARK